MYHTNLNHPTAHQVLISLLPFLPPSSSTKPTSWFSPSFQATKYPTNTIDRSVDQSSDQSSDDSPLFAFYDRSIGPPTPFHRISWFLVSAPRNLDYLIAKSPRFLVGGSVSSGLESSSKVVDVFDNPGRSNAPAAKTVSTPLLT